MRKLVLTPATTCPLTGSNHPDFAGKMVNFPDDYDQPGYYWFYPLAPENLIILSEEIYSETDFLRKHRREIEYLILNDYWPKMRMVDRNLFKILLDSSNIPSTPIDKIEKILTLLVQNSEHFGQFINLLILYSDRDILIKKLGIVNSEEFENLIELAIYLELIERLPETGQSLEISLTLKGWEKAMEIEEANYSNLAFIAMSFDDEMIKICNDYIKPAIIETGFEPRIVSDQHPDSDVTINDAILAGIKKSKFTIADFTHHREGVYFEAGYALGRGQKVIYTCHIDHIKQAHFDTRNYQHLIWEDGTDLMMKLINKIEVFIKV